MSNIEKFYGVTGGDEVFDALLWQYNDATNIQGLLQNEKTFWRMQTDGFWCWFLFEYFRLYGAGSQGVSLWSIILDLGVTSAIPPSSGPAWGFGVDDVGFDQGGFGTNNTSSIVGLPTEYAVLALKLRYFQLVGGCTVPQINAAMNWIFGYNPNNPNSRRAWVEDHYDMSINYKFNFAPNQFERFIFDNMDLLPRPAGVRVEWTYIPAESWGFGPDDFGFDNAPFGA